MFKFYRGGVKKVMGDTKPFIEAKFYIDEEMVSEVILIKVHLIGYTKKIRTVKVFSYCRE